MPASNFNDNKIAFEEEKKNLSRIEKRINAIIRQEEAAYQKGRSETVSWHAVDNEDRKHKAFIIGETEKILDNVKNHRSFIDSPYFGRFDLLCSDGKYYSFFIGKNGLSEGSDVIILDWRTPIGNTYYNKRETHFVVKGEEYDLELRRAIDIKKAKLVSVKTEYDRADLTLEGDVIDEFLISVLKDKRRNYKLTDIIRTIQQNQNKLIRLPIDESFVIQGCAGSGKTMILLHRLSYIAFNYPAVDFSRYYILTPNKNFNIHVDELSKSLGLNRIKRITVEGFYQTLLNARLPANIRTSGGGAQYQMNLADTDVVLQSEKNMSTELLKELYSNKLYDEIVQSYSKQSEKAVKELTQLGIIELLQKNNRIVRPFDTMNSKSYSELNEALTEVIARHNKSSKELKKKQTELKKARINYQKLQDTISDIGLTLESAKKRLTEFCEERTKECKAAISAADEHIQIQNSAVESALQEKEKLNQKRAAAHISAEIISDLRTPARAYDTMTSWTDELLVQVRTACEAEYSAVSELRIQLSSLAVYNFGRRARVRASLETAERILAEKAGEVLQEYIGNETDLAKLNERLAELDKLIADAGADISATQGEKQTSIDLLNACGICLSFLERHEYPDLDTLLNPDVKALLGLDCNTYIGLRSQRDKTNREITGETDHISRLERETEKLEKSVLSEEDFSKLKESDDIVRKYNIQQLLKALDSKICVIYEQHGYRCDSDVTYRHQIYLRLLLCSLYYGPNSGAGYHVSIDEAQDLAPAEYKMLRALLGKNTVFNLYGDVNQAVYEYKGIEDWKVISECISEKVYFLNENYRNTLQITDYCNKIFGAEIVGIGLNGEKVQTLPLDDAAERIRKLHESFPEMRTAVLYKRGLAQFDQVKNKLPHNCSIGSVDSRRISVIPVDEAKGLEFDAVAVIGNDMNEFEQYVAYTRALDNLIITKIP